MPSRGARRHNNMEARSAERGLAPHAHRPSPAWLTAILRGFLAGPAHTPHSCAPCRKQHPACHTGCDARSARGSIPRAETNIEKKSPTASKRMVDTMLPNCIAAAAARRLDCLALQTAHARSRNCCKHWPASTYRTSKTTFKPCLRSRVGPSISSAERFVFAEFLKHLSRPPQPSF